jgi:signal transduction histidine kinase
MKNLPETKSERKFAQVKECAEELQQVFFNIINNAVFAMDGGGILTISTRSLNNNELLR